MATVETGRMTAEEFLAWAARPENRDKSWELEKGEVVPMPPPGELQGTVAAWIVYLLWQYLSKRGKGRVTSNDTGLIVERDPDTVRGPDIMLFGESRRLDQLSPGYSTEVPLLVVEVRSPRDRYPRMIHRANEYLARGANRVWIVDPEDQTLAVCQLRENPQILDDTDELVGGDVLPDFRCRVADFFTLPGQSS